MSGKAARKSRQWTWAHDIDRLIDKMWGRQRKTDVRSVRRRYESARRLRRVEDARRNAERRLLDIIKRHRKPKGQTLRWGGQMYYPKHVTGRFEKLREHTLGGIVALVAVVVL